MNKRAQVFIIVLWILVIFSVLAISVGHRVSMALRLSRYQRDSLKAFNLAKAGLNRAITEVDKAAAIDSLKSPWSTGIEFNSGSNEIFNIIITDEDRKIDINKVDAKQLENIFVLYGLYSQQAKILKDIVAQWRGHAALAVGEELLTILEYFYQSEFKAQDYKESALEFFMKIKDLFTVYSDSAKTGICININTVSSEVLPILLEAITAVDTQKKIAAKLASDIIALRDTKGYFNDSTDLEVSFNIASADSDTRNLFSTLQRYIGFQSKNFKIKAEGRVNNITKNITVIYNRADKKFLYWHEN